jgi:glycosyltransferase involved in cell wall biosynthesis
MNALLRDRITTIVLITGDPEAFGDRLHRLLFDLRYYAEREAQDVRDPLLILVDGANWRRRLYDEELATSGACFIFREVGCERPGELINAALAEIDTPYFSILPLDSEPSTWYANKAALLRRAQTSGAAIVAGNRGAGEARRDASESFLTHPDDGFSPLFPFAWLRMLDLVPMANAVCCVKQAKRIGGFSATPAMQRCFWWEFCLRTSRDAVIATEPLQPIPMQSWHRYPFVVDQSVSPDDAARMMMQTVGDRQRLTPITSADVDAYRRHGNLTVWEDWAPLPESLPAPLRAELDTLRRERPLRITVLGDENPAHNQLCFFNYFELLTAERVFDWRAVYDAVAHPLDLLDADLVVFSRVAIENGTYLMRWCHDRRIPTIYMIDDNWFWLGRDWPEYEKYFTPGKPAYDNFIACLALADTALTYNAVLAEDLIPHTRRVVQLPTNVDLRFFSPPSERPTDRVKVGFAGSVRKNATPFKALLDVARERYCVDVFVMSSELPVELAALPPERVQFIPTQYNYAAYAQTVCQAAPDILLAPVGRSRFEQSKCPNKYLEITAAGAVGVYSDAEPYLSYVTTDTGRFAGDDVLAWKEAIEDLIDHPDVRQSMQQAALTDIERNFDTRVVLPQFLQMLLDAIAQRGPRSIRRVN